LCFDEPKLADAVVREAVRRGVLLECCGPSDEVVKIMPALNIDPALLRSALGELEAVISAALGTAMFISDDLTSPPLQPTLQGDQSGLDGGDHRGHAVRGA
jgi:diaminobutyrate-2-oxoglutarate transaminase